MRRVLFGVSGLVFTASLTFGVTLHAQNGKAPPSVETRNPSAAGETSAGEGQGKQADPAPPAGTTSPPDSVDSAPSAASAPAADSTPSTDAGSAQGADGESAAEVPRDPAGVKGLSPFREALMRGDAAFAARDYETAETEYADAIKKAPRNPIGHLRQAQVLLRTGDFAKAREAALAAERYAVENPPLRAQAVFLVALIDERRKSLDAALSSWDRYAGLGSAGTENAAKIYSETASERKRVIEARKKQVAQYQAVKERIQQRLKEAEEASKKDAKKNN